MKSSAPVPAHLRNEIFLLGNRHHGDALKGAQQELNSPGLSKDRRKILRAVIRHLDPHSGHAHEPLVAPCPRPSRFGAWPHGFGLAIYACVAIMLVTWAGSAWLRSAG